MYVPPPFREDDVDAVLALMREHPFALLVSVSDGAPAATHVPVVAERQGGSIVLRGHLAKANPQAAGLDRSEALVVFAGPHAYVSPRHYDRRESVPTWDYLAVHARGPARTVDAADGQEAAAELEAMLAPLIAHHEAGYQKQWDDLPGAYRSGMLERVVGFVVTVERLDAAAKLSQNKSRRERERIATALEASSGPLARATGAEVRRRLRGGWADRAAGG